MLTFDSIPQARIVRKGGLLQPEPPPPRVRTALGEQLYNVFAMAIGLWPLTAVVLLATGLLWMAGMSGTP